MSKKSWFRLTLEFMVVSFYLKRDEESGLFYYSIRVILKSISLCSLNSMIVRRDSRGFFLFRSTFNDLILFFVLTNQWCFDASCNPYRLPYIQTWYKYVDLELRVFLRDQFGSRWSKPYYFSLWCPTCYNLNDD